jgi:hypothetical protein
MSVDPSETSEIAAKTWGKTLFMGRECVANKHTEKQMDLRINIIY